MTVGADIAETRHLRLAGVCEEDDEEMNDIGDVFRSRIVGAWAGPDSQVISHSLYEFDLDDGVLTVQDRDFVFVGEAGLSISLPAGEGRIKQFRSAARNIKHSFLRHTSKKPGELRKGSIVEGVALHHKPNGQMIDFSITVERAHLLDPGGPYEVALQYTVNLGRQGPLLLFSGAVQPGDYDLVRQLGIEKASKSVTLVVRRSAPFRAHVFRPADMMYFPVQIVSTSDQDRPGQYRITEPLDSIMTNFGRAEYFTVAVVLS